MTTEVADPELLDRWSEGDKSAGEILTVRYFMMIRAYFLNKAPLDHEDLVQETFARLAGMRDRYRGESTFRVFLFGVARMVLLEHFRAKQRSGRFDPMEQSVADLDGGRASSLMARAQSHRRLLDALRELPLVDQELLELYYWQKLTAKEIAHLQGLPEPTVRSRVRAALKRASRAYDEIASRPFSDDHDSEIEGWLGELRSELSGLRAQRT